MKALYVAMSLLLALGLRASAGVNAARQGPTSQPNVVFILADDIGPGDIAVYHRERTGKKEIIPTPNIDRLAAEGLRFRDAHTPAALCAPTRYSVMTGNDPYRCHKPWGVWGSFERSTVQRPGVVPAGKVSDALIAAHDLMATLYAVTGRQPPADQGCDSFNLLPLLRDQPGAQGRSLLLMQGSMGTHPEVAIRMDQWKLLIHSDENFQVGEPFALFNLKENPTEKNAGNLLSDPNQQPRVAGMLEAYKRLRATRARTAEPSRPLD